MLRDPSEGVVGAQGREQEVEETGRAEWGEAGSSRKREETKQPPKGQGKLATDTWLSFYVPAGL